jgi:hypothetical protein
MLQLFLTVVMLALAAFEVVSLYEGHFVVRSVSQFESSVRERGTLYFLINHGVARIVSDPSFAIKVKASGSLQYEVAVASFLSPACKDMIGLITCTMRGETSFTVAVSLCKNHNHDDVIAADTADVVWDERRSVYVIHYTSHN